MFTLQVLWFLYARTQFWHFVIYKIQIKMHLTQLVSLFKSTVHKCKYVFYIGLLDLVKIVIAMSTSNVIKNCNLKNILHCMF